MSSTDFLLAFERLAEVLADDLLAADDLEVLGSHPGRAARVQADAIRQALRRAAANGPATDGLAHDPLHEVVRRPQREDKR